MLTFVIAYLRVGDYSGFSVPGLTGRWGGKGGHSVTADRIVSSAERLQNVTSRGP